MNVINLYLARNRNISLEIIDPDRNPGFVIRYDRERQGIHRGSLIVEGERAFRTIAPHEMYDFHMTQGGGFSITAMAMERRITSALLFASTGETPVVYEITGHLEIPLAALGLSETLERENYSLRTLNLVLTPVPDDAHAVILNNPQRDLSPAEAERLLDYLGRGGRLLVIANYLIQELPNLNNVLASYGLRFDYGVVFETDPNYLVFDSRTVWPDVGNHVITAPLADKTRTPIIMIEVMPLSILETRRRTVEVTPLLASSPSAYLRTDLDDNSHNRIASDISGPFILGAAVVDPQWVQDNEPQTRIVAIGCGALLTLGAQGIDGNRDLFMNSLTWLQDRPENITVRARSLFLLPLRMNLLQIIISGALFIFIIPAVFFIAGFVTWLKRRHL
jgi:ABC-2 type transport system permease protein